MDVNIYYDDYLLHYGVKGMKWGVRHDPELVGRKRGRAYQPYQGGRTSSSQNSKNGKRGLSSKAKRRLRTGALIVGGVLAAGAAVYLTRGKAFSKMSSIGRRSVLKMGRGVNKTINPKTGTPKVKALVNDITTNSNASNGTGHAAELASKIKPIDEWCNHNSFAASASNEYVSITLKPGVTYEGNVTNLMNKCLKNPGERIWNPTTNQAFSDSDRLGTAMARQFGLREKGKIKESAEGISGQIGSDLSSGGGHAFNWVVKDGKINFYDTHGGRKVFDANGQMKIVREPIEDASHYINHNIINGENAAVTRLDGLRYEDFTDYAHKIFDIKKLK